MANYNVKRALIVVIIKAGYNILEVEIGGESAFFLTKTFEKPQMGSVQSSPYFYLTGKDVTSFFDNYTVNPSADVLINNLRGIDEKEPDIEYQFSANHTWRYYTEY